LRELGCAEADAIAGRDAQDLYAAIAKDAQGLQEEFQDAL